MTATRPNPSPAVKRRQVLRDIQETGSIDGIHKTMLERFKAKGYLEKMKPGAWSLTKMGKAVMEGRIGKAGRGAVDMGSARHKAERGFDGRRRKATGSAMAGFMTGDGTTARKRLEKEEREHFEKDGGRMKAEWQKEETIYRKAVVRILGPKSTTGAVKIARADGLTFHRDELQGLQNAGWEIHPGGTIAAQVGKALKGVRPSEFNPADPLEKALGPEGETRAVVLVAKGISEETLHQLRGAGYDLSPAPKRIREGIPVQTKPRKTKPKGHKRPRAATARAKAKQAETMTKATRKRPATKANPDDEYRAGREHAHQVFLELEKELQDIKKRIAAETKAKAKTTTNSPEKSPLTGRFNPTSAGDLARVWKAWTGTDPDQTISFDVEQPAVSLKTGGRVTIPEKVVVLGRVSKLISKTGRLADFGAKGPLMVTDAKAERVWLLSDKPYHFDLEPSVIAYLARKPKFGDRDLVEYVHAFKGRVRAVMAGQIGAMTGRFRITPRGLED